jgi:hypothetical protein
MSEDEKEQLVNAFVNPLAWLEVDDPWKSVTKSEPTADNALYFLCPPGTDSDVKSVAARYGQISVEEENRLFIVPAHPQIFDKLIWPLRFAKGAYALGNYLATIALCGTTMEMCAILIFEMNQSYVTQDGNKRTLSNKEQVRMFGSTFERLGQERRVDVLLALKYIDEPIKDQFDFVRERRRKYMHFLSQGHERLPEDAVETFRRTIAAVKSMLGLDVDASGKIVLRPEVLQYLKAGAISKTDRVKP